MRVLFRRLRRNEAGATVIEYAMIAILVSVASVFVIGQIGTTVSALFFEKVANSL